jgi:CPA1 family monovalent cation:H+ antiporter
VSLFDTAALLVTLAAVFSYVNHRLIRLPTTIGLMAVSLSLSLGLIVLGKLGAEFPHDAAAIISSVDFDRTLMHGMLSFVLFAGALHLDFDDLRNQGLPIAFFATLGVVLSTSLVGLASFWIFPALGHPVPLVHCLLFGALISPTDPVAVLGMLKSAGAPRALEAKLVGESLFNDGVAVVVFTVLLSWRREAERRRWARSPGSSSGRRWGEPCSASSWATSPTSCSAASTSTRSRC